MPARNMGVRPAPLATGDRCCLCGACVSICPVKGLTLDEVDEVEPIIRLKTCINCRVCSVACPILNVPERGLPVVKAYTARTKLEEVRGVCQDGGVVSSMLIWALENDFIKAAIVSGISDRWPLKPKPMIVSSREEVLGAAGSRYVLSPNLALLWEAGTLYDKDEAAVVGLPCHIRAVWNMKKNSLRRFTDFIRFTVGLFCTESFPYPTFRDKIVRGILGMEPSRVDKVDIKGGRLIARDKDGNEKKVKVSLLKKLINESCRTCTDMTAELADISVGGVGSELGWSTVLIRSEAGLEVFERAVEDGFLEYRPLLDRSIRLVERLSARKRARGKKQVVYG